MLEVGAEYYVYHRFTKNLVKVRTMTLTKVTERKDGVTVLRFVDVLNPNIISRVFYPLRPKRYGLTHFEKAGEAHEC